MKLTAPGRAATAAATGGSLGSEADGRTTDEKGGRMGGPAYTYRPDESQDAGRSCGGAALQTARVRSGRCRAISTRSGREAANGPVTR